MTTGGGRALSVQQPLGAGHMERPARGAAPTGAAGRGQLCLRPQMDIQSREEAGTVRGAKSAAGASVTTGKSGNDPNVHLCMSGMEGGPCRQWNIIEP